ncbi:MAG: TRM11 family SAM-dependent methyltransferase [archaeon]
MGDKKINLDKEKILQIISEKKNINNLSKLREEVKEIIDNIKSERENFSVNKDKESIKYKKEVLIEMLEKVVDSNSLERGKHYLESLRKSIDEVRTKKVNDINLNRWREYDDIITDSLWNFPKRDTSGAHIADYWGNFIPQIPRQVMKRYTKRGEWVLDSFSGSGTTLIEGKRLGRNSVGIELNPEVVEKSRKIISEEDNPYDVETKVIYGDSKEIDKEKITKNLPIDKFQLVIMHPPYHDIIKFSEGEEDLSNSESVKDFLEMFGEVVDNISPLLEKDRYLVLVIGDKYSNGEWIPLGHLTGMELMKRGYTLKSTIVKNFDKTRGKRSKEKLWRYRALVGGFYVFKHEYIMIFKKTGSKSRIIDEVLN